MLVAARQKFGGAFFAEELHKRRLQHAEQLVVGFDPRRAVADLVLPGRAAAGIAARGFIFGAGVAISLGVGFVPIRKHGKLPGETIGQNYALEYGVDTIEMHADAVGDGDIVLLVDDLIATGGTAIAAVTLVRRTGARVANASFVIDLPELGGSGKLREMAVDVHTLVTFEGH